MSASFELRLEIPFFAPDSPGAISDRLKQAINEAAIESDVGEIVKEGKVEPTFSQQLPTKEEVGMVLAVLTFVIEKGPLAWPYLKTFFDQLRARLQKTQKVSTIKADITIDGKKIHLDGFTDEDTIKVITKEYKMFFQPRS
jgi:hypothetical protein